MRRRPLCMVILLWFACFLLWMKTGPGVKTPELPVQAGKMVQVLGRVTQQCGDRIYMGGITFDIPETVSGSYRADAAYAGWQILVFPDDTYMSDFSRLVPGDLVIVRGRLVLSSPADNPGQYDRAAADRRQKILFRVSRAELLGAGADSTWKGVLWSLRSLLGRSLTRALPAEDAGVMRAVLLGEKEEMSPELKKMYQEGGIAHVLAVSGLHVQLAAMSLWQFLRKRRFSYPACAVLSGLAAFAYCSMTGMSASALRALVMFWFWAAAESFGRSRDMETSLAAAAAVILLRNPLELENAGFWLSISCVLSLQWLQPLFTRLLPRRLRLLSPGLSVFFGTMPVCAFSFFRITPWSMAANLAVVPCLSFLAAFGALSSLVSLVCLPAGQFLGGVCHLLLSLFQIICRLEAKLPGAVVVTGRPSPFQIAVYYVLLALACAGVSRKLAQRFSGTPYLVITAAVFLLLIRPQPYLRLTAISVGQGESILIESGGYAAIVDCGSSDVRKVFENRVQPLLWERGIDHLDAVFLTHGDLDHYSGIQEMLEDPERAKIVGALVLSEQSGTDETQMKLAETAGSRAVPMKILPASGSLLLGGVAITCLYPGPEDVSEDTNEISLVLLVTRGHFRALLTGDLGIEGEERLLRENPPGKVTVLKTGHHGSEGSSGEALLENTSPSIALISAGAGNPYGHPHRTLLERLQDTGCLILRTDQGGALTVETDGETVWTSTFRQPGIGAQTP